MKDSYNQQPFSVNEFKKWMASQTDKPVKKSCDHAELINTQVESKINVKRLMSKMIVDEGEKRELAEDFRQHGGIVIDSDKDDNLLIEVDSGTFTLPKFFVKKGVIAENPIFAVPGIQRRLRDEEENSKEIYNVTVMARSGEQKLIRCTATSPAEAEKIALRMPAVLKVLTIQKAT